MKRVGYCLLLSLTLCAPARPALTAAAAWDVRPTVGADTNGGCYITGSTGTDFSQQDAAQYGAADLAIDAMTDTIVTSATHNFDASDVGNCLQVTAGTNFTTGFYRIVSVAMNAATLDRAVGTAGATGGTYAVGGALATITKALTANVISNKIFVKASGVLSVAADIVLNNNVAAVSATPLNVLEGYTTTHGDGGRAQLQITAGSVTAINASTNAGWLVQNFEIDCDGQANSTGAQPYWFSVYRNLKIFDCTSRGLLNQGNRTTIEDNEISGCTGCDAALYMNGEGSVIRNYVHDNGSTGIRLNVVNILAIWNISESNSGATSDCFLVSPAAGINLFNNTAYNCGQDGINAGDAVLLQGANFRNNILSSNARYGFNGSSTAGTAAWPMYDGNFYYNNATANRNNMDDAGAVNAINGAGPYTNALDVILSADPFTDAANGNFTLNNTAGGGAAVRGAGTPGPLPGAAGVGFLDGGAMQSQGAGGAGTPSAGAYIQ